MLKKLRRENSQLTEKILEMIDKSEKEIILLQPYYYRVAKFEKAIERALQRGVSVKIVTSQKRDQICYKNINNG